MPGPRPWSSGFQPCFWDDRRDRLKAFECVPTHVSGRGDGVPLHAVDRIEAVGAGPMPDCVDLSRIARLDLDAPQRGTASQDSARNGTCRTGRVAPSADDSVGPERAIRCALSRLAATRRNIRITRCQDHTFATLANSAGCGSIRERRLAGSPAR